MPSTLRLVALAVTLGSSTPLAAQQPQSNQRPLLTEADFARIEQLGAIALSPDGKWIAYDYRKGVSGPTELRYRAVSGGAESSAPLGHTPVFSANSRFLLFTITPDTSNGSRAARGASKTPPHNKAGIIDLRSGTMTILDDVQSFSLSKDGSHVALRRYAPPLPSAPADAHGRGADLIVRDLDQGTQLAFGDVAEYAWSDDGALLAMVIDVAGKTGNGVQLLDAAAGTVRSLDAEPQEYVGIAWRKKSDDLAVLRSRTDSAFADTSYSVIAWRGLSGVRSTKTVYDFAHDESFPAAMRVASYRAPLWAEDGGTLYFGIAPRDSNPQPWTGAQPARVEVWHWKDLREYHQQDRQAAQDRQKTQLVAWRLADNRLVRLADDSLDTVQLSDGQRDALASDERPYFNEIISGRPYRDVYRVDPGTGQRERIVTKTAFPAVASPGGRYVLYAQGEQWWSYDLATRARTNLTGKLQTSFVNMEDDHPVPEHRPYGIGGWTTGDRSVLLYDRFDVWELLPGGATAQRLTRGRGGL